MGRRRQRGPPVQAALLPSILPELGRGIMAFVLIYAGTSWYNLRNIRIPGGRPTAVSFLPLLLNAVPALPCSRASVPMLHPWLPT